MSRGQHGAPNGSPSRSGEARPAKPRVEWAGEDTRSKEGPRLRPPPSPLAARVAFALALLAASALLLSLVPPDLFESREPYLPPWPAVSLAVLALAATSWPGPWLLRSVAAILSTLTVALGMLDILARWLAFSIV